MHWLPLIAVCSTQHQCLLRADSMSLGYQLEALYSLLDDDGSGSLTVHEMIDLFVRASKLQESEMYSLLPRV